MKTSDNRKSQRGFFDLGLSLLVLAVAGGSIVFIERYQGDNPDAQPEPTAITANQPDATTVEVAAKGRIDYSSLEE